MGAPQEAITEDEMVGMELPDTKTKTNSKNAFTELMSKKPNPEKSGKNANPDKAKPKMSFDRRDGLGVYTVDPDAYDRVLFNNEHAVIIKDMFPKSSVHLLVLPKSDRNLLHPFKAFEDPQLLADIKVEVERAKKMVASELRRKYGQFSKSEQARIQARDADEPPEVLPEGRDWMKEIITGVHAVPSMNHLHVHVMSRDMTSFLVPLEKFPLADDDPLLDEAMVKKLAQDHEKIKVFDETKATFYDNVMQHVLQQTDALKLECAERARLQQQLDSLRLHGGHDCSTEQGSFVLALIDGNELIFRSDFLSQGDQGGRQAARLLFQTINQYVFSSIDTLSIHTKVIVRVYVDLEELCSLCLRAGLVYHSNQFKLFVRGFCQDKTFFDMIDVGGKGREVVIDKMEANLHMNIIDTHCKHILFGCEDGEIYAPMLRTLFAGRVEARSRITLLHGTQLDSHLISLRLPSTQMNGVFRDTGVVTPKVVDQIPEFISIPTLLRDSISPPPSSSSPATSHSSFRAASTAVQHPAVRELHSRQVSMSSNQSVESSAMPVTSWAMAAKKGAAVKAPPQSSVKEQELSADGIRRNRKGQRIDPPTPEFKKDEVNRLKKLKLCNAHHLRHNCPYPDGKCEHDHLYKCNAKELETLKLVARMSACIHGSECSDVGCIYGHRCPFPESRESGSKRKPCINGENCRFPPEMHKMDITPVRRLKIT
ncbi:HIT-like protein, partial [Aureobasidium melanogenum]